MASGWRKINPLAPTSSPTYDNRAPKVPKILEMVTNIGAIFLLSTGILTGALTNFVMKLLPISKMKNGLILKSFLPPVLSVIPIAIGSSYFTTLQKQGSRVGRFKIKQELAKNVNNFVYVDDEKLNDIKIVNLPQEKNLNISLKHFMSKQVEKLAFYFEG